MKQFLLIVITFMALVSCKSGSDTQSEKTALLTSTAWIASSGPEKMKSGICVFKADGTFTEDHSPQGKAGNVLMKGTWEWISENEIQFVHKTMSVNGVDNALAENEANAYIMNVTEISATEMKVITRFHGDSENSGFANEVHYNAVAL